MPEVKVVFYREEDGSVPMAEWLAELPIQARRRCVARLRLLSRMGHELRRPHSEHLAGTALYELRLKFFRLNLRMLYFFHGRTIAVVSHGFAKEREIPPAELALAIERMVEFKANPDRSSEPEW